MDVVERIVKDNLFQYPTERSVRRMAFACLARLQCLGDSSLYPVIVGPSVEDGKQACLYAMMRQYRLVLDFMVTVVGEKYRTLDFTWDSNETKNFLKRIGEQNESVAKWSESTKQKVQSVLTKLLVETEYLSGIRATKIEPVTICSSVENAIRVSGDVNFLPAFNCFT